MSLILFTVVYQCGLRLCTQFRFSCSVFVSYLYAARVSYGVVSLYEFVGDDLVLSCCLMHIFRVCVF